MTGNGTVNSEPRATYSERLLEVRREFALYDDRVVVRARWFPNRRVEHVVQLKAIKGEYKEIVVRYRLYRYAGWVLALGLLVFAMCYYRAQNAELGVFGYVALGVAIVGALLMAVTYPNRRIRFARFLTPKGRPALDIGCAGNDTAAFEKFAELVRRQIRRS
jgi:hypothetical protein